MADEGHVAAGSGAAPSAPGAGNHGHAEPLPIIITQNLKAQANGPNSPLLEEITSITSPRLFTPNPFSRKNTSLDIDDYFVRLSVSVRCVSNLDDANSGCRLGPATSKNTQNGQYSSRCTEASCPS